jgi:hypothetical protein
MSSFPVVSSLPSCLPRPCRTLSSREFKDGRERLLSMYISRDCDRLMQVGRGTDTGQVHEVILITIALFFVVDYLLVKVTLVVIMARGHMYLLYIRFRNQPRRGCIQAMRLILELWTACWCFHYSTVQKTFAMHMYNLCARAFFYFIFIQLS